MLLQHNIPVYENLEKTLENNKLAIVVTFTGTGKTYITLEYLDNHDYNALVVVPSLTIGNQWEKMTDRVDTMTFQYLLNHIDEVIEQNKYDCYVIDEAHHAGAERWGSAVLRLLTELDKPIIGLTADPIRYSDEFRDVSQDFWDDCVVQGYDLVEALNKGLVPSIEYIYTVFSDEGVVCNTDDEFLDIPELSEEEISEDYELNSKLNYTQENIDAIVAVLDKYLNGEKRKGLVFSDNINTANEAYDIISDIFSNQKVWLVHNQQSPDLNRKYLEEYNNASDGYIVSVNMLNEGVHVDNVDTIIMLRRTFSPSVFFQQIGRAISAGGDNSKNILVFDFVGNHSSIRKLRLRSAQLRRVADLFINGNSHEPDENKSTMIIRGIVYKDAGLTELQFEQIVNDIVSHTRWTPEEDDVIRNNYPTLGIKKCAELLPGRSPGSVHCRAVRLGVWSDAHYWSGEEDRIIREFYPRLGAIECSNLLHSRTPESIRMRAQLLKVKRVSTVWTKEEDDIIIEHYPTLGTDCIKLLPNRTKKGIHDRASSLGVKFIKNTWTEEEDNIIREYYPSIGIKCLDMLPNRNKNAVISRASVLGIKSSVNTWTEEEDNIISEYYPSIGSKCVDMLPNRTKATVTARAKTLGIKCVSNTWTEEEDNILRDSYPELGRDCYILFNGTKTESSVLNRANRLGIKFNSNKWSLDEDEILRQFYPIEGIKCASRLKDRTSASVKARARRLGITSDV